MSIPSQPRLSINRRIEGDGTAECAGYVTANPAKKFYPLTPPNGNINRGILNGTPQTVTLEAVPNELCCYEFSHWEGNGKTAAGFNVNGFTSPVMRLQMDNDRSVTAVFSRTGFKVVPVSIVASSQANFSAAASALDKWNKIMDSDSDSAPLPIDLLIQNRNWDQVTCVEYQLVVGAVDTDLGGDDNALGELEHILFSNNPYDLPENSIPVYVVDRVLRLTGGDAGGATNTFFDIVFVPARPQDPVEAPLEILLGHELSHLHHRHTTAPEDIDTSTDAGLVEQTRLKNHIMNPDIATEPNSRGNTPPEELPWVP